MSCRWYRSVLHVLVRSHSDIPHWSMYYQRILDGLDNITVTGLTLSGCLHACQQTSLIACTSVDYHDASRECRLSEMSSRSPGGQIIVQNGWDYYEMTTGKRIYFTVISDRT